MRFGDVDSLNAREKQLLSIRGNRIYMILQAPKFSLNPLMRIGHQITEAYRLRGRVSQKNAWEKALAMPESVHIREAEQVFQLYPMKFQAVCAENDDYDNDHPCAGSNYRR